LRAVPDILYCSWSGDVSKRTCRRISCLVRFERKVVTNNHGQDGHSETDRQATYNNTHHILHRANSPQMQCVAESQGHVLKQHGVLMSLWYSIASDIVGNGMVLDWLLPPRRFHRQSPTDPLGEVLVVLVVVHRVLQTAKHSLVELLFVR
jgi:hypothetical protein